MPVFINAPYNMIEQSLERILDLNVGIEVYANNNVLDELDMNKVKDMSRKLQDNGIACTVHAPFMDLSPGGFDKTIRAISRDKILKAVEMAHLLHAGSIVCHPGYDKWRVDANPQLWQMWFESSIETWTEVIGAAKDDLVVMLENIFEEIPASFIALFDYFKGKNLHFCFDSGHFNLFSSVPLEAWLVPLKDRIREMHLHDNHGKSDEHLPIGSGTFPFRELKAFLRQTKGNVTYTTEVHGVARAAEAIRSLREFLS
jgi:sugar phosphate isomerase/epimerase